VTQQERRAMYVVFSLGLAVAVAATALLAVARLRFTPAGPGARPDFRAAYEKCDPPPGSAGLKDHNTELWVAARTPAEFHAAGCMVNALHGGLGLMRQVADSTTIQPAHSMSVSGVYYNWSVQQDGPGAPVLYMVMD